MEITRYKRISFATVLWGRNMLVRPQAWWKTKKTLHGTFNRKCNFLALLFVYLSRFSINLKMIFYTVTFCSLPQKVSSVRQGEEICATFARQHRLPILLWANNRVSNIYMWKNTQIWLWWRRIPKYPKELYIMKNFSAKCSETQISNHQFTHLLGHCRSATLPSRSTGGHHLLSVQIELDVCFKASSAFRLQPCSFQLACAPVTCPLIMTDSSD